MLPALCWWLLCSAVQLGGGELRVRAAGESETVKQTKDAAKSAAKISVRFVEQGEVLGVVLSESQGLLLNEEGWPDVDTSVLLRDESAVKVDCEGTECEATSRDAVEGREWVAVLHFPSTSLHRESTIFDQVRQAVLWGASAVILLATYSDSVRKVQFENSYVSKPVVLISSNITRILKALASSTRVLVSMAVKGPAEARKSVGSGIFSTLTLWATCGRMASQPSWDARPWEGTVCLDVPAGKNQPSEVWVGFCLSIASLAIFLLVKALQFSNSPEHYDLLEILYERARQRERDLMNGVLSRLPSPRLPDAETALAEKLKETGEVCAICLDRYCPDEFLRILPCSHVYHLECVDPWLVEHRTCPLCKLNISAGIS